MCLKSRYTRHLEGEVARLQAENRAMLNSLRARSGFPPIDLAAAGAPAKKSAHGEFARGGNGGQPRKRSWHQWAIARTLRALKSHRAGGIVPLQERGQAKPNGQIRLGPPGRGVALSPGGHLL